MIHNSHFQGNLRYVYEEMKRREKSFRFIVLSKNKMFHREANNKLLSLLYKVIGMFQFYFVTTYHFATANVICLNDNFLPLAYMPFSKKTKIYQLWHGVGAFKKFGLSSDDDHFVQKIVRKGNQRITAVFVSSKQVVPIYEEALGISKEKIYPVGVPVTDYYFKQNKKEINKFYDQYPQLEGKKIVLYTPTFRNTKEENENILEQFDCKRIMKSLGEEYALLIRLHPQIQPKGAQIPAGCYDVTNYPDVKELYQISDVLITDYSSVLVEYVLLNKPIILYAYDLEQYDRGFYFDYKQFMPGPIVSSMEELLYELLHIQDRKDARRERFLSYEYDCVDGAATKRVVDVIVGQLKMREGKSV